MTLTLTQDFGGLARGMTLTFRAAGNEHSRAFLPVAPMLPDRKILVSPTINDQPVRLDD